MTSKVPDNFRSLSPTVTLTNIIRIQGLFYRYNEDSPALNGVDIELSNNAYVGIVGQNGSGKTTLVKHLNGLLKP